MEGSPLISPQRLHFGARRDPAPGRRVCEDYHLVRREEGLALLADGISGRPGAAVASQLAVYAVHTHIRQQGWAELLSAVATVEQGERWLRTAFGVAHRLLREQQSARSVPPADLQGVTTVLALAFVAREVLVAHVGDLRCYRLRDGRLARLTEDHTLLEQSRPHVTAEELESLRPLQGSALSRSLGGEGLRVEVDVHRSFVAPGDVYLACTNGLVEALGDADLARILGAWSDPRQASDRLARAARAAGAHDDITAVVVRVGESAAEAWTDPASHAAHLPSVAQP